MNILDKLTSDYTHAVHYMDGDVKKEYRCKADNAGQALIKCQWNMKNELQSCAIVTKAENES